MRWQALATSAALLLSAPAVAADAPWPALLKVGLIGNWAASCSAPPGKTNWLLTFYGTAGGGARRTAVRDPDDPLLNSTIDEAGAVSATTVRLRIRNDDPNWGQINGIVYDTLIEVAKGRMYTIHSTRADGAQMIKDGKFVSNGQPSQVLEKCAN